MADPASLLAEAKRIMGCSDAELAHLLGLKLSTTTAYIKGARREYLSAGQVQTLRQTLAAYAAGVDAAVERFDLRT